MVVADAGTPKKSAKNPFEERIGQVLRGKWHLDSVLGVGGMAAVFGASHRNGQRAAIKILHADFARDKGITDRFLREAYVSNKIGHPATVQVFDDDMTEAGEPFIVMELLEGDTARDVWKKCGRTMPVVQALQLCERVVDCLSSCHAIGVIHRDLKPANIFVTKEGVVKVLDFGVAQMRDATAERTQAGTALGTPSYMSPEQAMGLVDQLDGRSDLFSMGAMMHALVTGQRINNGRTEQEALVMAATKPVPSVARIAPNLPVEVIKLIDKALAWDRRNRFDNAEAMSKAMIECLAKLGALPLGGPKGTALAAAAAPLAPPEMRPRAPSMMPASIGSGVKDAGGTGGFQVSNPGTGGFQAPGGMGRQTGAFANPQAETNTGRSIGSGSGAVSNTMEFEVGDNDPRIVALRDLFKHVERLLPNARQYGWNHPTSERIIQTMAQAFGEALAKDPAVFELDIRPYSLLRFGHTIWEPGPPFDSVPYNLFACGVRRLAVKRGVTDKELLELWKLLACEPALDLPPEDDIASALWERRLTHVQWECCEAFAEGEATEREAFYDEAGELERVAKAAARDKTSEVEAKAMNVATNDGVLTDDAGVSPLALEDVERNLYGRRLVIDANDFSERYVDAFLQGYLHAAVQRDAPLVLAALRKSCADLFVAGRVEVPLQLFQTFGERLAGLVPSDQDRLKLVAGLAAAMFGGENLKLALGRLEATPEHVHAFRPVLPLLSRNEYPTMLETFRRPLPGALRDSLAAYLQHHLPGLEEMVAQATRGADKEASARLLDMLTRSNTPAARQAVSQLASTDDPGVAIEAKMRAAGSPDAALPDLLQMLEDPRVDRRVLALQTLLRFQLKAGHPAIARKAKTAPLHQLSGEERYALLTGLVALAPQHGEPVAVEIAKKGGLVTSDDREIVRIVACQVLGENSTSRVTMGALQEVADSRWGTSSETRAAAQAAVDAIKARLQANAAAGVRS
jgi:hypothetical protein